MMIDVWLHSWFLEPIPRPDSPTTWDGAVRLWGKRITDPDSDLDPDNFPTPPPSTNATTITTDNDYDDDFGQHRHKWWRSSPLALRHSARLVETTLQARVHLVGPMCTRFAAVHRISATTIQAFAHGFPPDWLDRLRPGFVAFFASLPRSFPQALLQHRQQQQQQATSAHAHENRNDISATQQPIQKSSISAVHERTQHPTPAPSAATPRAAPRDRKRRARTQRVTTADRTAAIAAARRALALARATAVTASVPAPGSSVTGVTGSASQERVSSQKTPTRRSRRLFGMTPEVVDLVTPQPQPGRSRRTSRAASTPPPSRIQRHASAAPTRTPSTPPRRSPRLVHLQSRAAERPSAGASHSPSAPVGASKAGCPSADRRLSDVPLGALVRRAGEPKAPSRSRNKSTATKARPNPRKTTTGKTARSAKPQPLPKTPPPQTRAATRVETVGVRRSSRLLRRAQRAEQEEAQRSELGVAQQSRVIAKRRQSTVSSIRLVAVNPDQVQRALRGEFATTPVPSSKTTRTTPPRQYTSKNKPPRPTEPQKKKKAEKTKPPAKKQSQREQTKTTEKHPKAPPLPETRGRARLTRSQSEMASRVEIENVEKEDVPVENATKTRSMAKGKKSKQVESAPGLPPAAEVVHEEQEKRKQRAKKPKEKRAKEDLSRRSPAKRARKRASDADSVETKATSSKKHPVDEQRGQRAPRVAKMEAVEAIAENARRVIADHNNEAPSAFRISDKENSLYSSSGGKLDNTKVPDKLRRTSNGNSRRVAFATIDTNATPARDSPMDIAAWTTPQKHAFGEARNVVPADAADYWTQVASSVPGKSAEQCQAIWDQTWGSSRRGSGAMTPGQGYRSSDLTAPTAASVATPEALERVRAGIRRKAVRKTGKFRAAVRSLAERRGGAVDDDAVEPRIATPRDAALAQRALDSDGVGLLLDGTPGTQVRQRRAEAERRGGGMTPELLARGRALGPAGADGYLTTYHNRYNAAGATRSGKEAHEAGLRDGLCAAALFGDVNGAGVVSAAARAEEELSDDEDGDLFF